MIKWQSILKLFLVSSTLNHFLILSTTLPPSLPLTALLQLCSRLGHNFSLENYYYPSNLSQINVPFSRKILSNASKAFSPAQPVDSNILPDSDMYKSISKL